MLRERIGEQAEKAKRAEADAWKIAEAARENTCHIAPELHSIEQVRAGLELQARALDVIGRVADERRWRVEGDLELYPASFHRNSSVDFAVVTDRGRILVETAPWTGGGITGHQRSVASSSRSAMPTPSGHS